MGGQTWSSPQEGGYMYSDELSDYLRLQAQPLTKFRQLCDAKDGTKKGLNKGDQFHWNVYTNLTSQGRRLAENQPVPEGGFTMVQHALTVVEAGQAVPFTGKLEALAKQDVTAIIDRTLKDDARKYFDIEAYLQFDRTPLRVGPTGGASTGSVTLDTNGQSSTVNNTPLLTGHVKAIVDMMKERNIPAYMDDDYVAIAHPTTYRAYKNQLETLKVYTETGLSHIFSGEIGRYENTRHIEQNFIPKGGTASSVASGAYDPFAGKGANWQNGQSSWAFFMGGDTVTEAVCIPEEIRAKIPTDFGRSRAIMWYYLGGFGLVHDDALNAKIVKWDSQA